MRVAGVLSFVLRESRGSRVRLVFFSACIAIGVAAVVAVTALSGALEDGMRAQARELLAADLALRAYRPLPDELGPALAAVAPGAERTDVRELATMVAVPESGGEAGRSLLGELKVIGGEYPFYGELVLEPAFSLAALLDRESAVVAPELLAGLGLSIGDSLRIGGADFRIAGIVLDEPDRLDFSLALGPRIFLSEAGLERTELLGAGNRVKYRALVRLPDGSGGRGTGSQRLRAVVEGLREALGDPSWIRFETHLDSQRGVRRGIERFASFLGLVALLSLILGGIGVAQVTRSWVAARSLPIAVWKSIGLRPREILVLYLLHALLFAGLGSTAGALLGGGLPFLLPRFAPELLDPALLRPFQPLALLRGMALGLGVAVLFALPALTAVWRVPPALVLRSAARPLRPPRIVRFGAVVLLALGLFASAWIQGGRLDHAVWFIGGLTLLVLLLLLSSQALVASARVLPRRGLSPTIAHGLAALARPGSETLGAIVALGLGTLVVTSLALVETRLHAELRGALPDDAPSVFLVDVQPDQWDGVRSILEEARGGGIDAVPVVMARLAAIDGVPVDDLVEKSREAGGRPRWVLTREQRLTWLQELPPSNRLIEGALWSDPSRPEISLEQDYAEDLGVALGSTLAFDVQGVPFEFAVTSLRAVEWASLAINFFLIVEPGFLDEAPQMRLASARIDSADEQGVQDRLVARFPNVTMLRVRAILEKIAALLERGAWGVRLLGGFTVLAGVAILAGAVAAKDLRRSAEAALLKTLGVTRGGILLLFATEFALTGAVAGVLGGLGAYALARGFLEEVLGLEARLSLAQLAAGVLTTVILAVVAGIAASGRALAVRPGKVLRG